MGTFGAVLIRRTTLRRRSTPTTLFLTEHPKHTCVVDYSAQQHSSTTCVNIGGILTNNHGRLLPCSYKARRNTVRVGTSHRVKKNTLPGLDTLRAANRVCAGVKITPGSAQREPSGYVATGRWRTVVETNLTVSRGRLRHIFASSKRTLYSEPF